MKKGYARFPVSVGAVQRAGGLIALVLAVSIASPVRAADVSAAMLGGQFTKVGGDPSASADGAIPAWTKPAALGGKWVYGQVRGQHFKFKDDKPLYSISASNVSQYADKLSPGQVEMLKSIPDYRMDVYPTRRTCDVPDFVAENTRKNVGFATLDSSGLALQEAWVPGVPFPIPTNGAQVMWNMKTRYRGVGLEMSKDVAAVSPRRGSNEWMMFSTDYFLYFPWGEKGSSLFSSHDRVETSAFFSYMAPSSMAGQAGVMTGKAGEQVSTFYYFPGQRRVRRMPAFSYDAPQIGLDNQYTVDESNVFSGPLDRFDWKLVGKQELLVPYNTFGLYDTSAKFEDVAKRDFIAPESRRYELHRVWVVEATVRDGMRHQAPKRLFYLDEDSWAAVMAVDFDAQGKVWKVREGQLIPVYETGACDVAAHVQYNLADGRYLFDLTSLGASKDNRWLTESGSNPRLKRDFYTSDNLRALSER